MEERRSSSQVLALRRKFEALNEEIDEALRRQHDSLSLLQPTKTKQEAVRMAKQVALWHEDSSEFVRYVQLQLERSRALRTPVQDETCPSEDTVNEQVAHAKLRTLRSDVRLLQKFRLALLQIRSDIDPKETADALSALEVEMDHLRHLLAMSVHDEKGTGAGGANSLPILLLRLYDARRELTSRVSDEMLRQKSTIDQEFGVTESMKNTPVAKELDILSNDQESTSSYDTIVFLKVMQFQTSFFQFVREKRSGVDGAESEDMMLDNQEKQDHDEKSSVVLASSLEEATLMIQKLRRELTDVKASNAQLTLTNGQLEEEIVHLRKQYEHIRQAHTDDIDWYQPRIQQLEESAVETSKTVEALELNVELVTKMYKSLNHVITSHEQEEVTLRRERDEMSQLLWKEIKKAAELTSENERKDRLVLVAMGARHEMTKVAKESEQRAKDLQGQFDALMSKVDEAEDEALELRQEVSETMKNLQSTKQELEDSRREFVREMEVSSQAKQEQMRLKHKLEKAEKDLSSAMDNILKLEEELVKARQGRGELQK